MAFNSVPPPSAAPVDPNSAFADALKRAKEVEHLLKVFKWYFIQVFNKNFLVRSRRGWDQVAPLQPPQRRLRIRLNKVRKFR